MPSECVMGESKKKLSELRQLQEVLVKSMVLYDQGSYQEEDDECVPDIRTNVSAYKYILYEYDTRKQLVVGYPAGLCINLID